MAGPDRISTCRIAEAAAGRDRAAGTFGVGENDGHQSGAPVGDPDGEIPHPELVHAGAGGLRAQLGRRDAQRREEQLAAPRPSHGRPIDARLLAEAEPVRLATATSDRPVAQIYRDGHARVRQYATRSRGLESRTALNLSSFFQSRFSIFSCDLCYYYA